MKYGLAFMLLFVAGCSSTSVRMSSGSAAVNSNVQIHGSSGLATALGLAIIAGGVYEAARSDLLDRSVDRTTPEMAPDRRISEQDCTKPLDYTVGNIRCK